MNTPRRTPCCATCARSQATVTAALQALVQCVDALVDHDMDDGGWLDQFGALVDKHALVAFTVANAALEVAERKLTRTRSL